MCCNVKQGMMNFLAFIGGFNLKFKERYNIPFDKCTQAKGFDIGQLKIFSEK